LQRDNQIPPLLLELNKRQTMVRQMSHDVFGPCVGREFGYSGTILISAYRTPANFNQ
jgi:hypothetical protein